MYARIVYMLDMESTLKESLKQTPIFLGYLLPQ